MCPVCDLCMCSFAANGVVEGVVFTCLIKVVMWCESTRATNRDGCDHHSAADDGDDDDGEESDDDDASTVRRLFHTPTRAVDVSRRNREARTDPRLRSRIRSGFAVSDEED